ncbi:MAG: hypothetical protein U1A78_41265 [Polyangia bacterium]
MDNHAPKPPGPVRGSTEPQAAGGARSDPRRQSAGLEWRWQGKHRFCCDGDLVIFELHGLFGVDDALCMFRLSEDQDQRYGYVLFLFDARDGLNMSQEARRMVGEKLRRQPVNRVTAIIGASTAMKTVTRLIQNASRLFGFPIRPVQFCDSQEEALTWLDVQRQQFLTKLQHTTTPRSDGAYKP